MQSRIDAMNNYIDREMESLGTQQYVTESLIESLAEQGVHIDSRNYIDGNNISMTAKIEGNTDYGISVLLDPESNELTLEPIKLSDGEKFDSFSKSATIGRDECFDEGLRKILLKQVGVSQKHLKIEKRSDNEFFVSDLKSSNGTLANNKKVYSAGITLESPITIELGEPGGTGIKIEVNND